MLNGIWHVLSAEMVFDPDAFRKCIIVPFPVTLLSFSLLDLVSAAVNLYLFIKPVLRLRASTEDDTLKMIAIKQCILSIIAVLSSILATVGTSIINMPQLFFGADINLSCLCIILS